MGWKKLKTQTGILAVHAALLPTAPLGKVLILGGDEHDPDQAQPQSDNGEKKQAVLYDVSSETVSNMVGPGTDVFCCGHAFAGDGSFIIGGGTKTWDKNPNLHQNGHGDAPEEDPGHNHEDFAAFKGETQCWRLPLHGPNAMHWEDFGNFNRGRWYPGMITLADGSIMAISGKPEGEDLFNKIPEISGLDEAGKPVWIPIELENPDEFEVDYYPRCHLFPIEEEETGVFISGIFICIVKKQESIDAEKYCSVLLKEVSENVLESASKNMFKKHNKIKRWRFEEGAEFKDETNYEEGKYRGNYQKWYFASTLLPQLFGESFWPRILVSNEVIPQIYFEGEKKCWVPTAPRSRKMQDFKRKHGMATLLPNGQIFLNGGIGGTDNMEEKAVMEAEFFSPEVNWAKKIFRKTKGYWEDFQKEHTGIIVRNYHAVALLLPDGSVWTAGSSIGGEHGIEHACLDIEIFYPDYFHRSNRLTILGFGNGIDLLKEDDINFQRGIFYYGTNFFEVLADSPDRVGGVVLTRLGSSTHAGNFDQRLLVLSYGIENGKIKVNTEEGKKFSSHTAPPGWYMLWLLDEHQIPCTVAKFILFTHKNAQNDKI